MVDCRIANIQPLITKYQNCISNEYLLGEERNNNGESKQEEMEEVGKE